MTSWMRAAAELTGPLYQAAEAGAAYQSGFGRSGSGTQATIRVSICHVRAGGSLDVETADHDGLSTEYDDWTLATDWLNRAVRPERIAFPLTLTAQRWEQAVSVDGSPAQFVFVGSAETWCALGRLGRQRVTARGTDWTHDGLSLVTVSPRDVSSRVPERG